jgi:prophage regulatory protein
MTINQNFENENFRIVRPTEVQNRLGVSRAKFADMVAKGQFPKPFTIIPGGRAVGWLERDVDAWIVQRSATAMEVMP